MTLPDAPRGALAATHPSAAHRAGGAGRSGSASLRWQGRGRREGGAREHVAVLPTTPRPWHSPVERLAAGRERPTAPPPPPSPPPHARVGATRSSAAGAGRRACTESWNLPHHTPNKQSRGRPDGSSGGGGGESLPMDGGGREWQSAVRGGQLVVVEAWDQCGWGGGNEPRIHRFRPRQFRQPGKRAGRHPLGGGRGGRSANKPRSAHGPATTESPPTDGRGPGHTRGMNTGLRCDCTTHINWQARRPSLRKAQRSKGGAGGVVVAIHFSG